MLLLLLGARLGSDGAAFPLVFLKPGAIEGGVGAESLLLSQVAAFGAVVGCATEGFGLDSCDLSTAAFDFGCDRNTAAFDFGAALRDTGIVALSPEVALLVLSGAPNTENGRSKRFNLGIGGFTCSE